MVIFRVCDGYGHAVEKAERYETLFAVVEAIVFEGERVAGEYPRGVKKVDPVSL